MVFPILGSGDSSSGYNIENSLRCNGSDSYLNFTLGTPTSQRIATFSAWAKFNGQRGGSNDSSFWSMGNDYGQAINIIRTAGTPQIYLDDSDQKYLNFNNGPMLRDPSAWYHFVVQIDTTQGTATNRMKFFINGTQLDNTTASHENQPTQNYDVPGLASGQTMSISKRAASSSHYIDGYIAEMIYLDGSIANPSEFGETDEDSGIWKPKKPTGLTFGNNGAWLEFKQTGTSANASGMGADTSGNTNHYTVSNFAARDVVTDSPTNNFATFNPLDNYYQQYTYAEGNLKVTTNADYYNWNTSTFGLNSGKWYVEAKATQVGTGSDNWVFGVATYQVSNNNHGLGADNYGIAYRNNGNYKTGDANNTHGASFSANDIVMIALDLDNDKVYFGHGGNWADGSGNTDESDLSNSSSAVDTSGMRSNSQKGETVFFAFGDWNSNNASTVGIGEFNFGNPPYSISSGNADANGYGNFEYAPPAGFYAVCSKNLAEYGG